MSTRIETIIVGGGQAGLSVSYFLKQAGRDHLILDRADRPADAWRNGRWDSFTLVTPNWTVKLPGGEYDGDDPDGFMPRDEVVRYFERYLDRHGLPVQFNTSVTGVEPDDGRYRVTSDRGAFLADNVVVATGPYQKPRIPAFAENLPRGVVQLHSSAYRNPGRLPDGAVLVVGAAQSGCQIAEELYRAGRKVYLTVGNVGRVPRRYRGRDGVWWLHTIGFFDKTLDQMPPPQNRFMAPPQASGAGGGHRINLHQFARDGVVLLGHLRDARDGRAFLAPDLKETLGRQDQFEKQVLGMIDGWIAQNGIDAPPEELPQLRDGYDAPEIDELDLQQAGITSVVWANGYGFDYSLVNLPIFDEIGYPRHQRGVTEHAGLYFIGLHFLHKMKSANLMGVAEDAQYTAEHIMARGRGPAAGG